MGGSSRHTLLNYVQISFGGFSLLHIKVLKHVQDLYFQEKQKIEGGVFKRVLACVTQRLSVLDKFGPVQKKLLFSLSLLRLPNFF